MKEIERLEDYAARLGGASGDEMLELVADQLHELTKQICKAHMALTFMQLRGWDLTDEQLGMMRFLKHIIEVCAGGQKMSIAVTPDQMNFAVQADFLAFAASQERLARDLERRDEEEVPEAAKQVVGQALQQISTSETSVVDASDKFRRKRS